MAHLPVRGHATPARALLLAVVSIALEEAAADGGVLAAGADRSQPLIAGPTAAIQTQNLFIESKDRPGDQAPRLLFVRASQEGSW